MLSYVDSFFLWDASAKGEQRELLVITSVVPVMNYTSPAMLHVDGGRGKQNLSKWSRGSSALTADLKSSETMGRKKGAPLYPAASYRAEIWKDCKILFIIYICIYHFFSWGITRIAFDPQNSPHFFFSKNFPAWNWLSVAAWLVTDYS